jgi:dihydrofolate reductase
MPSDPPEIIIIAAMAANRVIGCNNKIPWYIPGEQLLFKKITMGYPLIMGRLTWEDIGRPLPGRRNIVLSKKPDFSPFGGEHTGSLAQALQLCRQEKKVFVIGGEQIYREFMPFADKIILTILPYFMEGDTWFPEISDYEFILSDQERINSPARYIVKTYQRIRQHP